MSKAETWLHRVALALWDRVKVVYEGLQGPSDGLAGEARGNVASRPREALRSVTCRYDTQRPEGDDE